MNGIPTLYIDQYGNQFNARTLKELRAKVSGRVGKMYVDHVDGGARHVGYVIGQHWLTAYQRVERTDGPTELARLRQALEKIASGGHWLGACIDTARDALKVQA